jgi:preprotein translocase subunit SecY
VSGLANIGRVPELRKRLFFTLGMLAVYRLGVFVSLPGINVEYLRNQFQEAAGTLFGMVNMFSGGALENFSVFTLGVAPYISMSIIMQLLTPVIPTLEAYRKEGEAGRKVITRITRQATIGLALIQSYFIAVGLQRSTGMVYSGGFEFTLVTMVSLTAGTAFIMWLGEQITEKGLGNGISVLIFAGIVAKMPSVLAGTLELVRQHEISPLTLMFLLAFCLATIFFIVFIERSARKVPVQYPKRMVGNRLTQAQTQFMPLKLNMSGVLPPIFAYALLSIPAMTLSFSQNEAVQGILAELAPGKLGYELILVVLIMFFAYFYTSIIYNPDEVAENLKKGGGFIPSVRPGKQTAEYLYSLLNRLTLWGGLYLAVICIIPQLIYYELNAGSFASVFGGTAVLIAVSVTLDTAAQIESIMVSRNYEAFMSKQPKLRGVGSASYNRSRILKR